MIEIIYIVCRVILYFYRKHDELVWAVSWRGQIESGSWVMTVPSVDCPSCGRHQALAIFLFKGCGFPWHKVMNQETCHVTILFFSLKLIMQVGDVGPPAKPFFSPLLVTFGGLNVALNQENALLCKTLLQSRRNLVPSISYGSRIRSFKF